MQLKTILNRIERQPRFVYTDVRWADDDRVALEIGLRPRRGCHPRCSGCGRQRPGYDMLPVRRWQFVPLWGLAVFFVYGRRRVDCPDCGIVMEAVPWADGKQWATRSFAWFLARWAKRLAWKEVGEIFGVSWGVVFRAVEMAVQWGRARINLRKLIAIGVDEVAWQKGHHYLTVVYDIGKWGSRLLWVGRDREEASLEGFFKWLGRRRSRRLRFIASDMWQPYLNVIARKAKQAAHFLDRYHVVANMNKAIDKIRAEEAKKLRREGEEPVLAQSRWCLLKRPVNLTEKQKGRLAELLRLNLRTVRAYLLKERFQFFWNYISPYWAGRFLDQWCRDVMRSRLDPMKKIARSLRAHRPLLLNWFRARHQLRAGAVEGTNNKLKLITRRAYGFRCFHVIQIALYHALGDLPEPKGTHKFC